MKRYHQIEPALKGASIPKNELGIWKEGVKNLDTEAFTVLLEILQTGTPEEVRQLHSFIKKKASFLSGPTRDKRDQILEEEINYILNP